jgi:toxin FitB
MIVLDTNVLSALMQDTPDATVAAWLDRQPSRSVWTTAITVFEIRLGLDLLPEGRRRQRLEALFATAITDRLDGRVLPLATADAQRAGEFAARQRRNGFTVEIRDAQIAGIVLVRRATLATRNEKDFRDLGARVVNPWTAK